MLKKLQTADFIPKGILKFSFVQTALASLAWNLPDEMSFLNNAETMILHSGKNVKLAGSFSSQKDKKSKGLLILLHGWEGSINSTYILRTSEYFFRNGYNIFRLNYRDHGDTHHLNPEPFNGSLIEETYEAVRQASLLSEKGVPTFVIGFSLGGNFCLRIARRHSSTEKKLHQLKHCIAISPAIHPKDATTLMDNKFIIGRYFLKKWKQSIEKKRIHFPTLVPYERILKEKSVMKMTEKFIETADEFENLDQYFGTYTLGEKELSEILIPTTILTSKDDPIIRGETFSLLHPNRNVRISIQSFGGHNGFLENWQGNCWYFRVLEEILGE
ncbi:alpha/beta fold hydrolase [Leptospira gomenensis]|uniref:Alpha/beta fold hydrolase n=1 Tax=Leptospira gomenensis TaxID=2484974 RepID=A0A5F1YII3_9LEPT|nr:alpha/beta fold hydrolase [Leptospira gomenensis]TGK34500.1 alpha/beta fold hydrolase [Leptospira gomenensis]TGK40190.1 alpha/beta fold hydrolase [Leptospira gomenensis]TGK41885.1 alpha/beta fold hydrolase [Leptospira gomenensis]TGK55699.1 alpha/beta fold hydrolase [Leptospira gomenensis]